MLSTLGYASMEEFIQDSVPASIRIDEKAVSNETITPFSDAEFGRRAREVADMNKVFKSYIGMGYHEAVVPGVILRNVSGLRRGLVIGDWAELPRALLYRSPRTLPGTLPTLLTRLVAIFYLLPAQRSSPDFLALSSHVIFRSRKSPRVDSSRSSTIRPWSPRSPVSPSPTPVCSTREPLLLRVCFFFFLFSTVR